MFFLIFLSFRKREAAMSNLRELNKNNEKMMKKQIYENHHGHKRSN